LKHKRPQLELALTGQFTAHHGTLLALLLELIEVLDRQIATLDQQIGALVAPLQAQIAQLDSIPGVDITAARDIIAEIGTDMSRFGDAARLASWAGVCPGNHESAGKRYRGKTCKGNRYLRRVLVPCAWGARKTPTFLGRTFRRLEVRIGKKKAALQGDRILIPCNDVDRPLERDLIIGSRVVDQCHTLLLLLEI